MAHDTRFKEGWKGGPGRPPRTPEEALLHRLTRNQFQGLILKYLQFELSELKEMRKNEKLPVVDHCIMSFLIKAMKTGDYRPFEFLIHSAHGKPVQVVQTFSEKVVTSISEVNRLHEIAAKLINEHPHAAIEVSKPTEE